MRKDKNSKKISAKFINLNEEEKWLQDMLMDGWVLKKYDSEEVEKCEYEFERMESNDQKELIYKIDYRLFNRKRDYIEYKSIFEDAGWTILSKNVFYSKHIFYSDSTNEYKEIFSDSDSYKGRDKRKMNGYLLNIVMYIVFSIILFSLYFQFDKSAFGAGGFFTIFCTIKCLIDFVKHKKIYQSLKQ
ncbi:DUF2812 domain-containing protein [Niallia sp. MER 6]|uniref:DUF2812 domain-containing protein n=1 Tax=unclassified Niallia TaxID=2837522 RepID=UPI00203FB76B|nr:DUF2812 domain-containing protein [Niallia sp. MER 6]MCM3031773.1 DUF2812 domain-containing protein [Niallia sp. MER 6]